jgi:hypothetical protein
MLNGSQTMLNGGQTMLNDGESVQNGGATMQNGNQLSKGFAAPARCVRGFPSFWPDNSGLVGVTTRPDMHWSGGIGMRDAENAPLLRHSVTCAGRSSGKGEGM